MLRHLAFAILAASFFSALAHAQEEQQDQRDVFIVGTSRLFFQHYDCPPVDPNGEGATPENPIDLEFFSRAWANSAYAEDADEPPNERDRFECKWIRLDGFVTWDDFYVGRLYENPLISYARDNTFYFVENLASGMPARSGLAQRSVTIVARFYNLCAAGERALEAKRADGRRWGLGYPCHEIPAMMLSDVRIEKIHDATPQYILGEANRHVMGSLFVASADQEAQIKPVVRAWAASLRKGIKAFTEDYLAQYPSWDKEARQDESAVIANPNSYQAYLLGQRGFTDMRLSSPVKVFRRTEREDSEFDSAIGCICLAETCTDRWPLTDVDAETFLGDAACVDLHRWDGAWRW